MAIQDDDIITLVSTKGAKIEKINVPAYYLKAHRQVYHQTPKRLADVSSPAFRDMLSLRLTTTAGSTNKSVDLELDGPHLKIFVAYLTNDSSSIPPSLSFASVACIVSVCDSFGLDNIAARLLNVGFEIGRYESWDVFCLAAAHDQYHLAKTAVAAMGSGYKIRSREWQLDPLQEITPQMIRQANSPYVGQLLLALAREVNGKKAESMDKARWARVADDFKRP